MELKKTDLRKIGQIKYSKDGKLAIICNLLTASIEEILLREILKCFGNNYQIVETNDFVTEVADSQKFDIEFVTSLPWETYEQF